MRTIPRRCAVAAANEGLCLDFANTLAWRGSAETTEKLTSLADLLGWLHDLRVFPTATRRAVQRRARDNPGLADRLFAGAIALREAIYRIFTAAAAGSRRRRPISQSLNEALKRRPRASGWSARTTAMPGPPRPPTSQDRRC